MEKKDLLRIGIIAGRGLYPVLAAEAAKKQGVKDLSIAAVRGDADPCLETMANRLEWVYAGQLDKTIQFFKKNGIENIIFAGQIRPSRLFRGLRPDFRALKLLAKLRLKNAHSLFTAVATEFLKENITVLPATTFLDEYMVEQGVLGKIKPDKRQLRDIEYGVSIAKEMSRLNIGQTVVVKKGTVLAIEAFEGTDKAILRGGELGKRGVVVVKIAKKNQDMRFDIPCIGLRTVESLIAADASAIALQVGKSLMLEKALVIDALNKGKIAAYGVSCD